MSDDATVRLAGLRELGCEDGDVLANLLAPYIGRPFDTEKFIDQSSSLIIKLLCEAERRMRGIGVKEADIAIYSDAARLRLKQRVDQMYKNMCRGNSRWTLM